VVQEACSNVVRHAKADQLRITLGGQPGAIRLGIQDNGCGIRHAPETGPGRRGIGLRSMKDRVEFSGGTFRIESEPGTGTRIVADWPLFGASCVV
jgi:signal transduction histidine kinase